MPAPKGHARYGGREKGVPNKKTQDLMEICEQEGVSPFRAMLIAFKRLVVQSDLEDSGVGQQDVIDSAEKICQYIHPKRKAVEHTGADGEDIGIRIIVEDYGQKKSD